MNNNGIDRIIAYLTGQLDSDEERGLKMEAQSNPQLGELLSDMKEIYEQIDDRPWAALRNSAHALLDRVLKDSKGATQDGPPWCGMLTFDSRLLPLPEGVRPASVDACRLKYSLGPYRVELSCHPISATTYEIIGQVQDWDNDTPLTVVLRAGSHQQRMTANQFAIFRFPRVAARSYSLRFEHNQTTTGEISFDL